MRSIAFALLAAQLARAFSFRTAAPTQCGEWTVEWDGGSPPFYMIVVPTMAMDAGRIMNISMPATGSAPYRHSFTLPEPAGLQFVATMYDAQGFGSGGATDLLTVGDSGDTSCLDKEVIADFYFWTRPITSPAQCGNMAVTWNQNAQSPVGLHGIVIGGTAWDIPVSMEAESQRTMDWTVNLAAGTQFLLLMSDGGPFGTGGSTTILTAGDSADIACLDASSPHYTSVPPLLSTSTTQSPPSATAPSEAVSSTSTSPTGKTETRRPSVSLPSPTPSPPHVSSTGAPAVALDEKKNNHVIGVAVGVTIAVLLLLLLALCLLCRHRRKTAAAKGNPGHPSYLSQQPQMEEGSSGPRQMLHRLTVTGRPSHMRVGSRAFDNRPASMAVGPIAGLPNGASPPSVFTNDSASEHYELHPFPYEAPPPFHSLGINTSFSSDIKSPETAVSPALNSGNPFLDPPGSLEGSQDTVLSPAAAYNKSDSNESTPFAQQRSLARSSSSVVPSPVSAVDHVSRTACGVIPRDPPPVYVPGAGLQATNPDPQPTSEYSALPDNDDGSDTSSTHYSPSSYGHHRRHRSAVSMVSLL